PWPIYDEAKTIEEEIELVVQINGKVRGKVVIENDLPDEEIQKIALEQENVKKYINDKESSKRNIFGYRCQCHSS
ncbi:MAG TPA: hypothetical protein P5059_02955, partial [Candidatus Dojkabacteria bacterium]|nr:hypothetical protein [Candidatus Dojkabacteria bacterium]